MIVVAEPAPVMTVLLPLTSRSPIELLPEKPSVAPPAIFNWYVPAGTLIVVPAFRLANAIAPRKLQSFGAAVQAEAAAVSSVRSTVIVTKNTADPTVARSALLCARMR